VKRRRCLRGVAAFFRDMRPLRHHAGERSSNGGSASFMHGKKKNLHDGVGERENGGRWRYPRATWRRGRSSGDRLALLYDRALATIEGETIDDWRNRGVVFIASSVAAVSRGRREEKRLGCRPCRKASVAIGASRCCLCAHASAAFCAAGRTHAATSAYRLAHGV